MFRVISKRLSFRGVTSSAPALVHSCSMKTKVRIPDEAEYEKAIPFEKVPGPTALPIISIAHHFMPGGEYHNLSMIEMHRKMRNDYGDVVKLKGAFGKPDMIFVFNATDNEIMFRTEGQWPHRPGLQVLDEFRFKERSDLFQGIGGLLQDQGPIWQDTRTKVNPVMMQPKTVKSYIPVVQTIADEFVERIRSIRDEHLEVPADFSNETNKWALESISSIALDQRLNLMRDHDPNSDGQQLISAVHDFFSLSFDVEMMPPIWKLYKTKKYKALIAAMHKMTNITTKLIDKSIEEIKIKPQDADKENSVLEKLLKIDKRVAIIMALDMLMAGVDTTSTATLTILYQLAKNPEKQEILRKEIMEKLPSKDSQLTPELMANMPYLRAVMKESIRVKPVAIGTARRTTKDLVLSGYQIPKGVDVVMSQMLMSTEEEHFGRGSEFIPERFLKADGRDLDLKGDNPFAFLPFGFGSRMCIGRRLAELEMECLISKIIRNFRVEWHHPEMKYTSKLLYMPSGELKFRFVDI